MIDDIRLETLLKRSNQLPASDRLMCWAVRCLARDGRDMDEIDRQLNRSKLEHHWPFLKQLLSEQDLAGLMQKLAQELNDQAKINFAASGFKVGQQVQYTGNDNLKVKFLRKKALTIKSIQFVDGETWFSCQVPDSLDMTIPMNFAKKVY